MNTNQIFKVAAIACSTFVATALPLSAGTFNASVTFNPTRDHLTQVNRNVMGTGLMRFPFNAQSITEATPRYGNTSARLWSAMIASRWDSFVPMLSSLKPKIILCMGETSTFTPPVGETRVWYIDSLPGGNNLNSSQKITNVVYQIRYAALRIKALMDSNPGWSPQVYWEAWNEPQLAPNGAWQPADLARYTVDLANAVEDEFAAGTLVLPVKILAPMSMYCDATYPNGIAPWNSQLAEELEAEDLEGNVGGLVNHYYWRFLASTVDPRLQRATYDTELAYRIQADKALIESHNAAFENEWTLHISEWNTMPSTLTAFNETRDMAAAFHAFGCVKRYLQYGVTSSQIFSLYSTDLSERYASMTVKSDGTPLLRPTGGIMGMFNKYIKYQLMERTSLTGPTFLRMSESGYTNYNVPYLDSIGHRDIDGTYTVFLANRHLYDTASVKISGLGFAGNVYYETLTGIGSTGEEANVQSGSINVNNYIISVPPFSIMAVRWHP